MRLGTSLCLLTAVISTANGQYFDGYQNVSSAIMPVQMRVAYAGTGMMVSWNTFAQLTTPSVRYGLSPKQLALTATSNVSITYPTSVTYNNHVLLPNLRPNTIYYYQPVNGNTTYSFATGRIAGDQTPFTAALIVDMGTFGALGLSDHVGTGAANPLKTNEQTTIAAMVSQLNSYEFVMHPGDIAYADYWLKEEIQNYLPNTTIANGYKVYEAILNAFFDEVMPITSQKAYMVNGGNHEANCDNGGTSDKAHNITYTAAICSPGQTNFTGYRNRWRMPSASSAGLENFWYSYDHGMTHFIHLDTETDLGHGLVGPDEGSPEYSGPFASQDAQLTWLQADLAAVNRTKTPWVIALGHRPFYMSSSGICVNCRTVFEPLFYQYGVDLYLSGHTHAYEREAPIYNGIVDPAGLNNPAATMYMTNGAAGHYDGLDTLTSPLQSYSRYAQSNAYSWSTLQFHNCTHLTVRGIASANNTVFDQATLFKNRTCSGVMSGAPFDLNKTSLGF